MKYNLSLIIFVLIFYACSGGKSTSMSHTDSINEQISQSIKEFENRPIHKKLTAEIINNTPDDKLILVVVDNLDSKFPEDYQKELETVRTFTQAQQAVYVIWQLETEVNNGGFNQYYYNSSGQFADLTPAALQLVGANKFAALSDKANKLYKAEFEKINKHKDGTIKGFSKSYENNPLNALDDEFYKLYDKENIDSLQVDYIKKHKDAFIDK